MSSSEKRTIKINPELFKVSDKNSSRKKRGSSTEIKVRSPKPIKNKTLRKSVLNMLRKNIRDRESSEYKNTISDSNLSKINTPKKTTSTDDFKSDFERSVQYFTSLNDKEEPDKRHIPHNTTFKRESVFENHNPNPSIENSISNVLPDVFNEVTPSVIPEIPLKLYSTPIQLPPVPKYGCLKGGSLPTYRSYMRGTQRNYNVLENQNPSNNNNNNSNQNQLPSGYSAPPLFNKPEPDKIPESVIPISNGL